MRSWLHALRLTLFCAANALLRKSAGKCREILKNSYEEFKSDGEEQFIEDCENLREYKLHNVIVYLGGLELFNSVSSSAASLSPEGVSRMSTQNSSPLGHCSPLSEDGRIAVTQGAASSDANITPGMKRKEVFEEDRLSKRARGLPLYVHLREK